MIPNTSPPPQRKTHKKRVSALKLSSDTTATLPEYNPAPPPTTTWKHDVDLPSDKPPDYSDSAEEGDADTSSDSDSRAVYVPHHFSPTSSSTSSPRSPRRFKKQSHRRKQSSLGQSSNDPYLDSLLARSVHALEMSNTLLQSSISTQTSLTTILGSGSDTPAERTLEARAQVLSSRIGQWDNEQPSWMGDLEEITRSVEGLLEPSSSTAVAAARNRKVSSGSISSSLPSTSSLAQRRHGKRPSLDLKQASELVLPRIKLNLAPQSRPNLISPPPRALTQYVVAGQEGDSDEDDILLPSTIGLRASSSTHSIPRPYNASSTHIHNPITVPELASSSTPNLNLTLHAAPSLPILTDRPLEPSTPAYNMLSSFVSRGPNSNSETNTPVSSSFTSSFMRPLRRGSSGSTERGYKQNQARRSVSPERVKTGVRQSRSQTPRREFPPILERRTMTPPLEESSSSESCVGKQTILSLRKILDEQPSPSKGSQSPSKVLKPPAFLPRTPASIAEANTSTTTASVSRLLTKSKHTSSTRPPSPPRQSAMKRPSPIVTPSDTAPPSATSSMFPDLLTVGGVSRAFGGSNTPSSSGRSTPKRISFAELPESYASTRPEGAPNRFKEKQSRKKRGGGSKGKGKANGIESSDEAGWWNWFGVSGTLAKHEERMEDRTSRAWGGRMGGVGMGGSVDEWAI